jgi:gas vesicle protein
MTKKTAFKKPVTFILGGLVGTGAALLFAPSSGKESREKISGYAADMKGRAQCYAMRGRDRVTGTAKKTREYFAERKSLISASFDAGKKAYVAEKKRLTTVH